MCSAEQLKACNQHGGGYARTNYVSASTGVSAGYTPIMARLNMQYKGTANPMYTGSRYK